jgi:hypothetical protein
MLSKIPSTIEMIYRRELLLEEEHHETINAPLSALILRQGDIVVL